MEPLHSSAKGCQGYGQTTVHNGGRVLLAVLNLCVLIKISVATFDSNRSFTSSTQSIAAAVQALHDCVNKSVSSADQRRSRYVRRDDQVIDRFDVIS